MSSEEGNDVGDWEPGEGEPAASPWTVLPFKSWVHTLFASARSTASAPIFGIDGRGGAGKSTLAARIAAVERGCAVVHTDDLAWHHSAMGWSDLLVEQIIRPWLAGQDVSYRPDAWARLGRLGVIEVPAGATVLLIEGTGVIRRDLEPWLGASVWIQADYPRMRERVIARDVATGINGDLDAATRFFTEWQREEIPFLQHEEPWRRATTIVAGEAVPGTGRTDIAAGAVTDTQRRLREQMDPQDR